MYVFTVRTYECMYVCVFLFHFVQKLELLIQWKYSSKVADVSYFMRFWSHTSFIHTYIHTTHTYIHTNSIKKLKPYTTSRYIHWYTSIHTQLFKYIHTYMHSFIHTYEKNVFLTNRRNESSSRSTMPVS